MTFPLISVIVPVYNIERYVGKCIESIINQTYANLEVLLVDDGSTDACPSICDLYASKDKRIKVIHKPNGGLVSARKAGISLAAGEFVTCVDGDDWISPTFVQSLANEMIDKEADLVVACYSRDIFEVSVKIASNIPCGYYTGESLSSLKREALSKGNFFKVGITAYLWNKLFRREKLLQYQLQVDDGITIGEDAAVSYPYLMSCESISIIDNYDYHYRQREDSMLKKNLSFAAEKAGLIKLRANLSRMCQEANDYNLPSQIDDYVLGSCIIRSGKLFGTPGGKIAVYSAGTYGQQVVNKLSERPAVWVDDDYWEYRRCGLNVDPVSALASVDFDFLYIATINYDLAVQIKAELISLGVAETKIGMISCPPEGRPAMLKEFLYV